MAQGRHSSGPDEPPARAPGWTPPHAGGVVDPISVARAAMAAQESGQVSVRGRGGTARSRRDEEGSSTPLRERFGHLVGRARSVIGSGDAEPDTRAQREDHPEGEPMADKQADTDHKTATDSGSESHEKSPEDPGWVFHRRVGEAGHEGWLYHYADGTMVSEDGTVHEYPSGDAGSLSDDPSVEDRTQADGSGSDERDGEAPTEVSGAQEEPPSEPPDRDDQREQSSEESSEDAASSEASAQDGDAAVAEASAQDGDAAVAEAAQGAQAPAADEEEASVEPKDRSDSGSQPEEAGQDEGRDDTEDHDVPDDKNDKDDNAQKDDKEVRGEEDDRAEKDAAEDDGGGRDDRSGKDDRGGKDADEDAPVPEAEGGDGPLATVTDAVTGVWLKDKIKGKQTLEPAEGDDRSEESSASASEAVDIPAFIEYSPTNLLRYVSGGVFVVAAIATVLLVFYAVTQASALHFILAGVCTVIALLASWVLLSWEPTVISIREGILEVAKGPQGEQVDLRDPRADVDVGHHVSSPTWKTVVHRAGAKDITIRAGQVKARQFAAIVEHYVSHPRQKPLDEDED